MTIRAISQSKTLSPFSWNAVSLTELAGHRDERKLPRHEPISLAKGPCTRSWGFVQPCLCRRSVQGESANEGRRFSGRIRPSGLLYIGLEELFDFGSRRRETWLRMTAPRKARTRSSLTKTRRPKRSRTPQLSEMARVCHATEWGDSTYTPYINTHTLHSVR
jgi:hypothetical protein